MQSIVFPHSPKNIPSSQLPAMGRRKHRQESTCQDASVLTAGSEMACEVGPADHDCEMGFLGGSFSRYARRRK